MKAFHGLILSCLLLVATTIFATTSFAQSGATACEDSCQDTCDNQGDQCGKDIDRLKSLCKYTGNGAYCKAAKDRGCKASTDYCKAMCFVDFGEKPKCEPPKPSPDDPKTGSSSGEPHIVTIDGQYYDFQAAGDFVLAESLDGEIAIHIRQVPVNASASVNAAIGIRIGELVLRYDNREQAWQVNQGQASIQLERVLMGPTDGVDIKFNKNNGLTIAKPGSIVIRVHLPSNGRVEPYVRFLAKQETRGLLGNNDGIIENDVIVPEGAKTREWLNTAYADQWRLTDATSLLPYADGEDVSSFTIKPHPSTRLNLTDSALQQASVICERNEVPENQMGICIYDVAATGDPTMAEGILDMGRTDIVYTLQGEQLPVAILTEQYAARAPDDRNSASEPAEDIGDWTMNIWTLFASDRFKDNWVQNFTQACRKDDRKSQAQCECQISVLNDPERTNETTQRARIAFLMSRPEVTSNSTAMDALRGYIRLDGRAANGPAENRQIINDYRLYLAAKDACQ